jgi:hypothetical protein
VFWRDATLNRDIPDDTPPTNVVGDFPEHTEAWSMEQRFPRFAAVSIMEIWNLERHVHHFYTSLGEKSGADDGADGLRLEHCLPALAATSLSRRFGDRPHSRGDRAPSDSQSSRKTFADAISSEAQVAMQS